MKKFLSLALALAFTVSISADCGRNAEMPGQTAVTPAPAPTPQTVSTQSNHLVSLSQTAPKYVFLFIGDGMSYPQFQTAADYLGALADTDYMQAAPSLKDYRGAVLDGPAALNFMGFEASGSAVTYNSNSFAPDSASTGTAISTGRKTYAGTLNMDEAAAVKYETITEKVHSQLGMKVGIVSSVNLNHATPAAFYAHQASRTDYYEIGLELIGSGFEYFAGGGLLQPTGSSGEREDLYRLAADSGYTVIMTQAEAEQAPDGPVIIIDEHPADSSAMAYELDRTQDMWSLADYVKKGIELLDNDRGFFLMCEGGKIDWACHANDAASAIHDTLAFSEAVQAAIDFAKAHAGETLILVTGDHETGGMSIGFAGTDYDTCVSLLSNQKISCARFDSDYVSLYKEQKTPFETVLSDIEALFGLKSDGSPDDRLVLTDYEKSLLKTAYEKSIHGKDSGLDPQAEYTAYGKYEPLTVTATRILNNKAGISFTTFSHTGLPTAVFADGVNAEQFNGYYDNTAIYEKLAAMLGVK